MANTVQKINRRSQVVAHRAATSATDGKITDSTPAANFQGVTLEEASFAQVQHTAPVTSDTDLNRGKIIFTDSTLSPGGDFDREDHALYIPIKSYGRFDGRPNVTLSGSLSKFGNSASEEILPKGGGNHTVTWHLQSDSKIKLGGQVGVTAATPDTYAAKITANPTTLIDATHNSVHTFAVGDILRIDEGWTNVNCLDVGTDLTSLFSAADVDAGTDTAATTTSGAGEGLTLDIVSDGSAITSVKVNTIGVGYEVGDTITIAANTLDASHAQIDSSALTASEIVSKKATALEVTLAAADLSGEVKKLATANDLLCGKTTIASTATLNELTAANIQNGVIVVTGSTAMTISAFDSAADLVSGLNLSAVDEYFDFSIINGTGAITMPTLNAGNVTIAADTSAMFRIRAINVTALSEDVEIYRIA